MQQLAIGRLKFPTETSDTEHSIACTGEACGGGGESFCHPPDVLHGAQDGQNILVLQHPGALTSWGLR